MPLGLAEAAARPRDPFACDASAEADGERSVRIRAERERVGLCTCETRSGRGQRAVTKQVDRHDESTHGLTREETLRRTSERGIDRAIRQERERAKGEGATGVRREEREVLLRPRECRSGARQRRQIGERRLREKPLGRGREQMRIDDGPARREAP